MRCRTGLLAGREDALAYAKGQSNPRTRETAVVVERTFVVAARLKAGLTQQEFARAPAPRSARFASGSAVNAAPRAPRECWCASWRATWRW